MGDFLLEKYGCDFSPMIRFNYYICLVFSEKNER